MWSKAFLKAALERALKSAAQSLLVVWGVADGLLNVFAIDWREALGVAAGMFIMSLVFSVASGGVGGEGPSLTKSETLTPQ